MKKVGIVIPVYNTRKYLLDCLGSAENQLYPNTEIIIIDNGSDDGSDDVCEKFARRHKNVTFLRESAKGVCNARNKGIRNSDADYLTFIDSDDIVSADYINVLVNHMQEGGMSVCNYTSAVDSLGQCGGNTISLNNEQAFISALKNNGIQGFIWGKLFDLRVIKENRLKFDENISICEDLEFVCHYLSCCNAFVSWNNSIEYYYRQRDNSALNKRFMSYTNIDDKSFSELIALNKIYEYTHGDRDLEKAVTLRKTKSSATTLRVMASHRYKGKLYNDTLAFLRRHCVQYLVSDYGAFSSKVSVALGAVSPELEYRVYKLANR